MEPIKIKALNKDCFPSVGRKGDAGIDLRANIRTAHGYTVLHPKEKVIFGTGLRIKVPEGWVGIVLPRSGKAFSEDMEVGFTNTAGVIDSNYVGEIKVYIKNNAEKQILEIGDFEKIAQMVIVPAYTVYDNLDVSIGDDLGIETERGEQGFGSSGKF